MGLILFDTRCFYWYRDFKKNNTQDRTKNINKLGLISPDVAEARRGSEDTLEGWSCCWCYLKDERLVVVEGLGGWLTGGGLDQGCPDVFVTSQAVE